MTKKVKKSKKVSKDVVGKASSKELAVVRDEGLLSYGMRSIRNYAETVNLERSVPDIYDGLKPVHRRILYAASMSPRNEFVKSARIVGNVLGKFHPHGDSSVYGAMITMVQQPTPPLDGKGNWGNLIDGAAAYRYTNARVSKYGYTFFDPNYINKAVTSFVPNYDDKDIEPVTLPALLPNVILNGADGIGVGITTCIPTFTVESVVEVLQRLLKGEKLKSVDFAKALKPNLRWGGSLVPSKENKKAWLEMFTTPEAAVMFQADLEVDHDKKQIVIDTWPPGLSIEKFVEKVRGWPETDKVYNSKGTTTFTIVCKKAYNAKQFEDYVKKVQKATQVKRSFKINVTQRTASVNDGVVSYTTQFLSLSVPQLIVKWLKERIALELRSLAWRTSKQQEAIAYSKLLIYAASKLDVIFKSLKASDSNAYLRKHLKITEEQANQILELKVRQLSKLDQDTWKKRLKEQEAHLKQLQAWTKKPKAKVLEDTVALAKSLT